MSNNVLVGESGSLLAISRNKTASLMELSSPMLLALARNKNQYGEPLSDATTRIWSSADFASR